MLKNRDSRADNIFIINNKDISMNCYYAYHGPTNSDDFEYEKGYGVSRVSTWQRVKEGDRVFVIQHPEKQQEYKLCGLYEIVGHYEASESVYPFRFRLEKISQDNAFIVLDEQALNRKLPDIKGDSRLSIFKQHFCRQGATFQAPLDHEVVAVLNSLVNMTDLAPNQVLFREDGLRMLKVRNGQQAFRESIMANWENRCAITGSALALEACHIESHATKGTYAIENGIALAADLHTLFDNDHLSFENNKVVLSLAAQNEPRYARLHNQPLRTPLKPVRFITGKQG